MTTASILTVGDTVVPNGCSRNGENGTRGATQRCGENGNFK